ncbi:hypothetical protein [Colwellia sp. E150_009]
MRVVFDVFIATFNSIFSTAIKNILVREFHRIPAPCFFSKAKARKIPDSTITEYYSAGLSKVQCYNSVI